MTSAYLTPRQVADQLGDKRTTRVLNAIHAGELRAVNLSNGRRPTWRISEVALLTGR